MSRKAYWISIYNDVLDEDKLAAYAALAGPALIANGGRIWPAECRLLYMNMARCSERS